MKKQKVLFIDRDGTLVVEPPSDKQLDSFEKLTFIPGVFKYLSKLAEQTDFALVMVTNQDGLGTDSFPADTFWPVQNFIVETLAAEGILFSEVLIDPSLPEDNSPNRKPGIGLVKKYQSNAYDLENSFVIGDRLSDMEFAKNLGCQGINFRGEEQVPKELAARVAHSTSDWAQVFDFIKRQSGQGRSAQITRNTNETKIDITLDLDTAQDCSIDTGIKFFDHMLEQIAKHAEIGLQIKVVGDLEVDEHHTIEDTALALGSAFAQAIGDKRGLERYGFALPMDDCLAQVAIDFGGRPWLVWAAEFKREKIGAMPTEMFMHFFKSFSDSARCNLNIKAEGQNEHHKIEAIFKAFARSIKMATRRDLENQYLPTTKGTL